MKKFFPFVAFASACFLFSCEGSTVKSSNTDEKGLQASRDIYKGIETGDMAKLSSIADDAVDHDGPNGEVKGGQAIKAMISDFHNHIKNLKMDVVADAANNGYVFSLVHMTGTALDSTMGFPKGANIDSRSVDVSKFNGEKLTDHWGFVNMTEMMKMMPSMGMPAGNMNDTGMKKDSTK